MLNRLALFSLFAAGVAILSMLWVVLDRPVERFVVQGDLSTKERDRVEKQLATVPFEGILSTRLQTVVEALDGMRWAREVDARRQWPDTIVISLSREQPIAKWGDGRYLSAAGDLLELPDDYHQVPVFNATVSTVKQTMNIYRLLDQLARRQALRIKAMTQDSQGGWRAEFADGPAVMLGAEQLNERMSRFLAVYQQLLADDQPVAYFDARYSSGVAVRFQTDESLKDSDMLVAGVEDSGGHR